jgi:hypothetical protein
VQNFLQDSVLKMKEKRGKMKECYFVFDGLAINEIILPL